MAGFLLFRNRTLHRTTFDYSAQRPHPAASAEALFNAAQAPVVRVRSPYSEKPALGLVFCFLEYGLFIELRSIIRPKGLTLRASAEALF
ncbi:hypothetical protein, partial [Serratia marcescens]